jgi:hypothetical protein
MSSNTGKDRARRYRQKLATEGGRTLAFYIDGANDKRLKDLMDAHGLGQGDTLKFAIHLAHAATFATEPEPATEDTAIPLQATEATQSNTVDSNGEPTTDEQPTADTGHPKQARLPGVESQATPTTKDNTDDSNTPTTDERQAEPTPKPTPPADPSLEQIADATTWSGIPWATGSRPTLPKKMLARWIEQRHWGDGWTLQKMTDALNEAGIPTSMGKLWKRGSVDGFMRRYCK